MKWRLIQTMAMVLMLAITGCEETADRVQASIRESAMTDGYVLVLKPKSETAQSFELLVSAENKSLKQEKSWNVMLKERPVEIGTLQGWTWHSREVVKIKAADLTLSTYTIYSDPQNGALLIKNHHPTWASIRLIFGILAAATLILHAYDRVNDWLDDQWRKRRDKHHEDFQLRALWSHKQVP